MTPKRDADVSGRADCWRGPDLQHDDGWKHHLSGDEIDALLQAANHARATGKPMRAWRRADFPLPALAGTLDGWSRQIDQRGFILIRGMPVGALPEAAIEHLYWGIGLHLGTAVPQNTDGDVLGHVRDVGADPAERGVRLYKTRAEQDFHTDGADIVGLLCLKPARVGGISRIVSSIAIFDEITRRAPHLVDVLFEPFPFDRQGQEKPGERGWFEMPVARRVDGRLCVFFIPWYIRESQDHVDAPRLTPSQLDAVAMIETIANDPAFFLDMNFEPGDIQFLHNTAILHKRTAYEDHPEPDRKRHLLRLWLTT